MAARGGGAGEQVARQPHESGGTAHKQQVVLDGPRRTHETCCSRYVLVYFL